MITVAILTDRSVIVTSRPSLIAKLLGAEPFKRRAEKSESEFGWSWTGSAEAVTAEVADAIWRAYAAQNARSLAL